MQIYSQNCLISEEPSRENLHTYVINKFDCKPRAFIEISWKNVVHTSILQMTILYGACALICGWLDLEATSLTHYSMFEHGKNICAIGSVN